MTSLHLPGYGQDRLVGHRLPVKTDAFVIANDTLPTDAIVSNHLHLFFSTDQLGLAMPENTYWFRLDFNGEKERLVGSDTIFVVTGLHTNAQLFYQENSRLRGIKVEDLNRRNYHSQVATISIPVSTQSFIQGRYVFLKVPMYRGFPNLRGTRFVYNTKAGEGIEENFTSNENVSRQIPVFILVGIAGLLFIFNLLLYFTNKEKQYLFYGSFLLWQLTYYTRGSPIITDYVFHENHYVWYLSTEIAQVAANLSYLLFIKHFLDSRSNLPFLNTVINAIAVALTIFIVADLLLLLNNPFFGYQYYLMYGQRYFMAAFAVFGVVYLLAYGKGYLPYFVIAGTTLYVGGALATMFLGRLNYMVTGSALESIIFAVGLSYKIRLINREKLSYEQEAYQVKLSALRAQMNPHFIFNSLNSIQHLITQNDKANALRYLTRFSSLLRQILENSITVNIPVIKEIELLKIYLELESFRFDQSFKYTIEIDKDLDVHNLELPILLLQPYVENAISHGLLPKQGGEKELHIRFRDHDDFILCTIKDTGIGRQAAMDLKKNIKVDRPSRGMSLSRQRLQNVNRNEKIDELIRFIDSDTGTTVEIKIPKN